MLSWAFSRVPRDREPYVQQQIPSWHGPVKDGEGRWIVSHVMNQDFAVWAGQGRVADRTREALGASDRGVVMLRRQLQADLDAIARGADPKGLIRDPAANRRVALPVAMRKWLVDGFTREQFLGHPIYGKRPTEYIFQSGQPGSVRTAYLEAMGLDG